ncbi:MAG: tryptophan synthase subunit alpha [Chloroflexi bacterium]|nr:tryptophan synthase subunit alpha [Chloroflexota bacterium]|tara:strand:+ start:18185 stop:18985 length:801 start_codon:yes stop_codon:yes gene_type:complete
MMNRIDALFNTLSLNNETALIPFIPINWPSADQTIQIVENAFDAGAHAIELGVPFSDPLADGATNQLAYQEALNNGASMQELFKIVQELRDRKIEKPIIAFSYFNPIHHYGLQNFANKAKEVGLDGVIVVDLPPEESKIFSELCVENNLHQIFLLAPTSTDARIENVTKQATGFIYCVSVSGTTGVRENFSQDLIHFVEKIKRHTQVPIVIGFGISSNKHIKFVSKIADGAVVGSAFVESIRANQEKDQYVKITEFIQNLVEVNNE